MLSVSALTGHNATTAVFGDSPSFFSASQLLVSRNILSLHTASISALARDRSMWISGQRSKGIVAFGEISADGEIKSKFTAHDHGDNEVTAVCISPNGKFAASADRKSRLCVYSVDGQSLVASLKLSANESAIVGLAFALHAETERSAGKEYTLAAALADGNVVRCVLEYDKRSLQYQLTSTKARINGPAISRSNTCAAIDSTGVFFAVGTSIGEVSIFNIQTNLYRITIPVASGNTGAVLFTPANDLVVGTGDGKITVLTGTDQAFRARGSTSLTGSVMSLSLNNSSSSSSSNTELVATTNLGKWYRVAITGGYQVSSAAFKDSPTGPISAAVFTDSGILATLSSNARASFWDIQAFRLLAEKAVSSALRPTSAGFKQDTNEVISGWSDGSIRSFNPATAAENWVIPTAHRGVVSCIAAMTHEGPLFLSAGEDGAVRVWSATARRCLGEFQEHKGMVTGLAFDVSNHYLVHSCGHDRSLFSYDLKAMQRLRTFHQCKLGEMTAIAQFRSGEKEVITSISDGTILIWDKDHSEPVHTIRAYAGSRVSQIALSPITQQYLAVAADNAVHIYDLQQNRSVATSNVHCSRVSSFLWIPGSESEVISTGEDGLICRWNFSTSTSR